MQAQDADGSDEEQIVQPVIVDDVNESAEAAGEGRVVLDWKGDPMLINPGDKLPFF